MTRKISLFYRIDISNTTPGRDCQNKQKIPISIKQISHKCLSKPWSESKEQSRMPTTSESDKKQEGKKLNKLSASDRMFFNGRCTEARMCTKYKNVFVQKIFTPLPCALLHVDVSAGN